MMKRTTHRLFAVYTAILLIFTIPHIRVSADGESENTSAPQHTYSSVLMEAETGAVLSGTDPDTVLPIGSQTKLMTVLLTAQAVADGRLTADTEITVSPSAEGQQGAVIWLLGGEKMSVTDLLKGVIIGNANDAAVALACKISGSEAAFTAEMNAEAFNLGMRSTRFADATGLSAENVGTAHDLGLLCRALLKHRWLTPIFTTWRDFLRGEETELVSENTLTRTYEGLLGMKAGHGEPCGYTLTLAAERDGLRCIAVVLGCDDEYERFTYGKNLLANGFSGYYVTTPDFSTEFLQPLTVHHGTEQAVLLRTGTLLSVAAPKGKSISCVVVLPLYAEAPIAEGQTLGAVAFYCGDSFLFETPICAAESVESRDFHAACAMLLANLFK